MIKPRLSKRHKRKQQDGHVERLELCKERASRDASCTKPAHRDANQLATNISEFVVSFPLDSRCQKQHDKSSAPPGTCSSLLRAASF